MKLYPDKIPQWLSTILQNKILTVILVLVLLYLIWYHITSSILQAKVDAEIKKISQSGAPYEIHQTVPPPVRDEVNSARYYIAAVELVDENKESYDKEELKKQYRENKAEILKRLEQNREVFFLVKKGGELPGFRMDLDYEKGFEMKVPNFIKMRRLAYLSAYKAMAEIDEKDIPAAVDTCVNELRFINRMEPSDQNRYGSLIFSMICLAQERIIMYPLQEIADSNIRGDYSELINEMDRTIEARRNSIAISMENERVLGNHFIEKAKSKDRSEIENMIGAYPARESGAWYKRMVIDLKYGLAKKPVILSDQLNYLRTMDSLIAKIKEKKITESTPDMVTSGNSTLTEILTPNVKKAYLRNEEVLNEMITIRDKLIKLSTKQ